MTDFAAAVTAAGGFISAVLGGLAAWRSAGQSAGTGAGASRGLSPEQAEEAVRHTDRSLLLGFSALFIAAGVAVFVGATSVALSSALLRLLELISIALALIAVGAVVVSLGQSLVSGVSPVRPYRALAGFVLAAGAILAFRLVGA